MKRLRSQLSRVDHAMLADGVRVTIAVKYPLSERVVLPRFVVSMRNG